MRRQLNRSKIRALLLAFSSVCAVTIALLVPALAHATNDKTYPATSCRKAEGSGGIMGTRDNGSVENEGVSALVVNCPIVRDHTVTTDGYTVQARVNDKSTDVVRCTVTSLFTYGTSVLGGDATADTNAMGMGLGTLTLSPGVQASDGHTVLKCILPGVGAPPNGGRSALLGYVVREPTGDPSGLSDSKNYTGTYAEIVTGAAGAAPFIKYPDMGLAKPTQAMADDTWVLPIIRDYTLNKWERIRFRFKDSDSDKLANCLIWNYNENGTTNGFAATASQDLAPGDATAETTYHPSNGLHVGPIVVICTRIQTDLTATRYDIREWNP